MSHETRTCLKCRKPFKHRKPPKDRQICHSCSMANRLIYMPKVHLQSPATEHDRKINEGY